MPSWQSYSYLWGPVMAIVTLSGLVLALRWTFGRGGSLVRPVPSSGDPWDYGLLEAVAAPRTEGEADDVRHALAAAGIRCTVTRTTQGLRVLVWPVAAARARHVVRGLHDAS